MSENATAGKAETSGASSSPAAEGRPDCVTVITAKGKLLLTKRIYIERHGHIDERGKLKVQPTDTAKYFEYHTARVGHLSNLVRLLRRLERMPQSCIIRGELLPGVNPKRARRLLHPDRKSGDPATVRAVARQYVQLDMDGIACPPGIDPIEEPDEAVGHLISLLPEEFHDARCYWQWSSRQSVKDERGHLIKPGLSAHLWFWLDRPIPDDDLKHWAETLNETAGYPLVDPALFQPVQEHYTAFPIFEEVTDPLSYRSGIRRGLDRVVALVLPERTKREKARASSTSSEELTGELGDIAAAFAVIPNNADWLEWNQKGMACWVATSGSAEGFVIFDRWSQRSKKYDAGETLARWEHYATSPPSKIGAGSIFYWAKQACPGWRKPSEDVPPPPDGEEPTFPDAGVLLDEGDQRSREAVTRFMAGVEWQDKEQPEAEAEGFKGITDHEEIDALFDDEPVPALALIQTLGSGKTRAAIEAIALAPAGARINFLAPDHALGAELLARITQAAGDRHRVAQVFGRDMVHPNGEPMCREADLAAEVRVLGHSVQSTLCKSKRARCPHFDGCRYQQQRADRGKPGIDVGPHAYLAIAESHSPLGRAHLTVIDEDPTKALIRDSSVPLDAISADELRGLDEIQHAVAAELSRLARDLLTGSGTGEGITPQHCKMMAIHWYGQIKALPITPDMPRAAKQAALDAAGAAKLARRVARFWLLLGEVAGRRERRPFRLYDGTDDDGRKVKRVEMVWSLDPRIAGPVLVLDGTANDAILRRFWPQIAIERIDIKAEHYHALQITDSAVSKTMLGYNADAMLKAPKATEETRARNNRAKLAQIAEVVAALADGRVPLFTYKAVAEAMREEHPALPAEVGFQRHDGAWAGHLGNVRGLDRWRDAPAAIIAGRLVPSPAALEKQARAIFYKDPRPMTYLPADATKLPRETRVIRMADGTGRTVEVETHPDPLVAAVLDQICRADLEQTVHRLRLVRRTPDNAPLVVIATNVVLNLTVHQTTTWDELLQPIEVMRARGFEIDAKQHGAANLASALCPDLWKDAKAFRNCNDRSDALTASNPYKKLLIGKRGSERWVEVEIRLAGARYAQRLRVSRRHPDPHAAIEARVGPLDHFRLIERTFVAHAVRNSTGTAPPPVFATVIRLSKSAVRWAIAVRLRPAVRPRLLLPAGWMRRAA
jgi:hypothetical protein